MQPFAEALYNLLNKLKNNLKSILSRKFGKIRNERILGAQY